MASAVVKKQKDTIERWVDHVHEYYETDADLICQATFIMSHAPEISHFIISAIERAAEKMAQGGCFIVYYGHLDEFAKENPGLIDRRRNDEHRWEQYKRWIGRAFQYIFKHAKLTDEEVAKTLNSVMYPNDIKIVDGRVCVLVCEAMELILVTSKHFKDALHQSDYRLLDYLDIERICNMEIIGDRAFLVLPNPITKVYKELFPEVDEDGVCS